MQQLEWTRNGKSSRQSQHGDWRKVKSKKEVILEPHRDKKKVHFATLMVICHPNKTRSKNPKLQKKKKKKKKNKGRVVFRGGSAKDDSGAFAK